ncbi:MAG: sulfite exporter TauE/SafE family protein [Oscillospiraceae bacterium]|nr:sulfite exporter TauE/SafE family protein [Oscillospiraceae bacterium]
MEWVVNTIIGFLAAVMASMGLGGGSILLLYLTLFTETSQYSAQGINLLFFIPIAVVALILHSQKKLVRWQTVARAVFWGLLGVLTGFFLGRQIGEEFLRTLFYIFLLIIGIKDLFFIKRKKTDDKLYKE